MSIADNLWPDLVKIEEDGTEIRVARVRTRAGDLKILTDALQGKDGFSRAWYPRMHVTDKGLIISIPTNTGKSGEYQFLGLDVFIPLSSDENKNE